MHILPLISHLLWRNACRGCRTVLMYLITPQYLCISSEPFLKKSFMGWYLSSGKRWVGRAKIRLQTLASFRGGGFISLENLLYFARNFQKTFQDLLRKQVGERSVWEYPFAVAGINITFMLIQMLDLEAVKPRTIVGATFLKFLSENESAFDILYCIAFKLMDQQWLSMRASYMEFNTVMKSTRRQLERELMLEDITHLEDLPSYALLSQ
ncbi:uncharacterized protein LOC108846383 isoform X2 [Raphanus sativus]|uniref:Uncharacterized protein LOC108846383 isoform X2 n=2 Tax=Raphanus sativus TaxID=3726 RepID=A0A9W3DFE1_RAPSA|nr:uncharacterized protein LOC108846383 isoform X2 [Raphanus sativus]